MITLNLWILFCSKVRYRSSDNFKGHCTFRIHNQGYISFCFSIFQLHEYCLMAIFPPVLQSTMVQQVSSFLRQGEAVTAPWIIYMRLHRNSTAKQTEIDPMIYRVFNLRQSFISLEVICGLKS